MKSRKVKLAVGIGLFAMTIAPSVAYAYPSLTSYQGADYSRNYTSGRALMACNVEVDGHAVSAAWYQYGSGYSRSVFDYTENNGSCVESGTSSVITRHQAVEQLPLMDAYGPWVYVL